MSTGSRQRELLPTADPTQTLAAVRRLLRPRRGLAVAGLAAMTGATAVGLLTQPLLGHIVDLVADHRGPGALTLPAVLLVLVAVVQGGTTALGRSLTARLGETVLAGLRESFVERALRLPQQQLERAGSGDLTARVTGDVSRVAEAVRTALPELVRSALAIVLTLAALAVLDWRFLLAALLAVPIQAATARWYVRRAVPIYAQERIATGAQQQQLLDTVGAAATIRALRLEAAHTAQVEQRSWAAVQITMRGVRLILGFYSRLHVAEYVGLAAVLLTGLLLVRDGSASIGMATAAALYFHSLFDPVNAALVLLDDLQSAGAGLARLVGVTELAESQEAQDPPGPTAATATADCAVAVTGLSHAYAPGRPVLQCIDLTLRPGEHVALVGESGAGKSTLAALIAGIHRPTGGTVRLSADPNRLAVGLVTQEVHVFAGTLADDLRLARPGAQESELRTALDQVGALDWAEALPEALQTVVGEGGHRLSPTQAQQMALARLILADPPIAVLDEATAEAGSAGALLLEAATAQALEGRTALIVAHRLSQAATADRIVVMDDGRIVESGTHDQLSSVGGRYAALWGAWSGSRASTAG